MQFGNQLYKINLLCYFIVFFFWINMKEIDGADYTEDLKSFRWQLYHYRDTKEIVKCLSRYYFKKYNFKYFAEEIIIAGYDLQKVSFNDNKFAINDGIP